MSPGRDKKSCNLMPIPRFSWVIYILPPGDKETKETRRHENHLSSFKSEKKRRRAPIVRGDKGDKEETKGDKKETRRRQRVTR